MKRKSIRIFGRSIPVLYLVVLATFVIAAAAILLVMQNPITGSQVLFDVTVLEIDTNDDGGGISVPDTGMDPAEAGDVLKHPWDVAYCAGTPAGSSIDFVWDNVYSSEPLFCQIRAVIQNDGSEDLALEDITVTAAPVVIADQPGCGVYTIPAAGQAVLVFSLGVDTTALDATGWADGSIDLNLAIASTLSCP